MGQKVNPIGIRLGIVRKFNSIWYAKNDYSKKLLSDMKVRKFLKRKLSKAGISLIRIERPSQNAKITIHAARPGIIIGKKGGDVEILRKTASKMMGIPVHIDIEEVRRPEADAQLVAESVAQQLEKRIMFRRAMKRAISAAQRAGAEGIKIKAAGRLGGAEIARSEGYHEGRVPLQTFRADIDYGVAEALTTYGLIGVKVWIFKGEVFADADPTGESSKDVAHSKRRRTSASSAA